MNCSDKRIIIIGSGIRNSISDYLFRDIKDGLYRGAEYIYAYNFKGKLFPLLHRALHSRYLSIFKLYNLIDWTQFYSLNSIDLSSNTIILFNFGSLFRRYIEKDYLKRLKKDHPTVTLIWLLMDSINDDNEYADLQEWMMLFDRCITFDPNDAKKYSMEHRMLPYEKNNSLVFDSPPPLLDLFYVGREKSRSALLSRLGNFFRDKKINYEFIEVTKRNKSSGEIKRVRNLLPYENILMKVSISNCILEIINNGCGTSLRYYEAVVYNKKLLTNNRNVYDLPYYDERFIKYFEKLEDIDCEWIKKVERVDYLYDGLFNLESFLSFLRN